MFFELHEENKIGYKQLTNADLGRKATSKQTHIGLFGDVFTYYPNNIEIDDAMVIFEDNIELLSVSFDRIKNPDNTYRSPKIKTGGRDVVSVVSFIRDKSKEYPRDELWYLFWFGLKSEQPVFFLFNKSSNTYRDIVDLGISLNGKVKSRLTPKDASYSTILKYLEEIVNVNGKRITAELEIVAQTNERSIKKYRAYDIEKAKAIFSQIGEIGEKLINEFFAQQIRRNLIAHYDWKNKEKESGLPYDFTVETLDGELLYLDVKTTNFDFQQKMIFSSQEIEFVNACPNKYHIYRVYTDENNKNVKYLKICENAKDLFVPIQEKTEQLKNELNGMANVETIKLAVMPLQDALVFGDTISL